MQQQQSTLTPASTKPEPTRTAMFPVLLCPSLTHTPGLKRELDTALWETHTIANYSVDAYSQLLLAAANGKIGGSSLERSLVASYVRVMLSLPTNKKQLLGLEGRPKGEGAKFNYHYFFTKLSRPAESSTTAYGDIKKLADTIPKLLTSKDLKPAKRPMLEQLLADCAKATQAIEYFQSRQSFPLEPYQRRIVQGLVAPIKRIDDLLTLPSPTAAAALDSKWQSVLLTHAAQRVRSYLGLKAGWDLAMAGYRERVPEWRDVDRMVQELRPPTARSDGAARLVWLKTHAPKLCPEKPFSALTREDEKLPIGAQFALLFERNNGLEERFDKIISLARLIDRTPTYTRCDPILHPVRVVVPAPQSGGGYRDLRIDPSGKGSVTLKTLRVQAGAVSSGLTTFPIRVDTRLLQVSEPTAVVPRGDDEQTAKVIRRYFDRSLGTLHRSVVLRGARISPEIDPAAHRPSRARTQLEIRVEISVPPTDAPRSWKEIPEGTTIAVVSFGHLFGTTRDSLSLLVKDKDTLAFQSRRSLRVENEPNAREPELQKHALMFDSLRALQEELDSQRSSTGRLARGQRHGDMLQTHLNALTLDQVRKEANLIVKAAMQADVRLIAVPYLKGVNPNKFQDETLNRLFMGKSRAKVVEYLKGVATRAGIPVVELSPYGMKDLCSGCNELGAIIESPKFAEPHFACPCCKNVKPAVENSADNIAHALTEFGTKTRELPRTHRWREYLSLEKAARRASREERMRAAHEFISQNHHS